MKKKISLKEIQQIELNILKIIDKICQDNKLTYYLAGGTLLGAVRHQGFIPWDDDIDIAMPRSDYDIFIDIMSKQKEFPYLKILWIGMCDEKYYLPFAKVVDIRTQLIYDGTQSETCHKMFVDIFPIDASGNDEKRAKRLLKKCGGIGNWIGIAFYNRPDADIKLRIKMLMRKYLYTVLGYKRRYYNSLNILKKYTFGNSRYIASTYGMRKDKELIETRFFTKVQDIRFENNTFKAPIGYKQYLKQMYGNYIKLPPVEKRKVPHATIAYWKEE